MLVEGLFGSEFLVMIDSKMYFVDLVGSECFKNMGVQGEWVKEGILINVGLVVFGKVILQLFL